MPSTSQSTISEPSFSSSTNVTPALLPDCTDNKEPEVDQLAEEEEEGQHIWVLQAVEEGVVVDKPPCPVLKPNRFSSQTH